MPGTIVHLPSAIPATVEDVVPEMAAELKDLLTGYASGAPTAKYLTQW